MMDTTGLRLSLGFVLRHCMNITWTSVQSLWRQPLQASASRSPPVKQHYSTVQHRTVPEADITEPFSSWLKR